MTTLLWSCLEQATSTIASYQRIKRDGIESIGIKSWQTDINHNQEVIHTTYIGQNLGNYDELQEGFFGRGKQRQALNQQQSAPNHQHDEEDKIQREKQCRLRVRISVSVNGLASEYP